MAAAVLLSIGVLSAATIGVGKEPDEAKVIKARMLLDDGVMRALVLGDSVARGAGDERGLGIAGALDEQFRNLGLRAASVVNLGINGARTSTVQRVIAASNARSVIRAADVIVLSVGGNDLYGDSRARLLAGLAPALQQHRTLRRVEQIVSTMHGLNPGARIYVLGLYNPYRRSAAGKALDRQVNLWDARLIARFAASRHLTVVRICDLLNGDDRISSLDRFHPGSRGYELIAERIVSSL